jgi:hypothetical protein
VATSDRPILYLAMDRPRQAARSFRRMVAEADRQLLDGQLVVWVGPLPVDPTRDKDQFADFAEEICPNVGTIIVDSVKDFALASQTIRSAPPSTCRGRKSSRATSSSCCYTTSAKRPTALGGPQSRRRVRLDVLHVWPRKRDRLGGRARRPYSRAAAPQATGRASRPSGAET